MIAIRSASAVVTIFLPAGGLGRRDTLCLDGVGGSGGVEHVGDRCTRVVARLDAAKFCAAGFAKARVRPRPSIADAKSRHSAWCEARSCKRSDDREVTVPRPR